MKEINCEQVSLLLSYFIGNKLSKKMMSEIEYHLNVCEHCRKKYMNMLKITQNYKEIQEKICGDIIESSEDAPYLEKEYKMFQENLSAYIDNELNDKENIRIKKIAIINPLARQELEDILYFRQILQDSFAKTKTQLKKDFSCWTIDKLCKDSSKERPSANFLQIINLGLFFFVVCAACVCAILK